MTNYYLTQDDVQNYGTDLINFTQRAAAQYVAPHLQALGQQNAELEQQLAVERRKRLDQEFEAAVPNYRQIDNDPRWHRWLLGVDALNGRVRQQLLDDAIAAGSAVRVVAFFREFLREHAVDGGRVPSRRTRTMPLDSSKFITRDQIKAAYALHQKGKLVGPEWDRLEQEIIRAGAEGRVIGGVDIHGK